MAKTTNRTRYRVNRNLLGKANLLQPVAAAPVTAPASRLYEITGSATAFFVFAALPHGAFALKPRGNVRTPEN